MTKKIVTKILNYIKFFPYKTITIQNPVMIPGVFSPHYAFIRAPIMLGRFYEVLYFYKSESDISNNLYSPLFSLHNASLVKIKFNEIGMSTNFTFIYLRIEHYIY